MWKKVILIQTCICLFMVSGYHTSCRFDSAELQEMRLKVIAAMSKHHTVDDVIDKGIEAAAALVKAPSVVTNYIISAQNEQQYGKPIDEVGAGETTSVYAVSGGQVVETGRDSEIGSYVKIRHDGAVSVYGNCKKLYVKEGEHVRRGHVIASFAQTENNRFYYDLIDE